MFTSLIVTATTCHHMHAGEADYIGEAVSQVQHATQAAHAAVTAGAEDEIILAALLHGMQCIM